jgi:hypothetical protein
VKARRWHRRAQSAQERERVEVDGDSSIGECFLERDTTRFVIPDGGHKAVGTTGDTTRFVIPDGGLLRDGGPEDVLEESLAAGVIEPPGAGRRMQRDALRDPRRGKAIERDAQRPLKHHRSMRQRQRAAAPFGTGRRGHSRDRRRRETR